MKALASKLHTSYIWNSWVMTALENNLVWRACPILQTKDIKHQLTQHWLTHSPLCHENLTSGLNFLWKKFIIQGSHGVLRHKFKFCNSIAADTRSLMCPNKWSVNLKRGENQATFIGLSDFPTQFGQEITPCPRNSQKQSGGVL